MSSSRRRLRRRATSCAVAMVRARMAAELLYRVHAQVAFDTLEDEELKAAALAEARRLLGYHPATGVSEA